MTKAIEGMASIVAVRDVLATAAWFVETLGFEQRFANEDGSYALVVRDEGGVILVRAGDEAALEATRNNVCAYFWVRDLDALWQELRPKLERLSEGSVRAPFNQDYEMREFHVKDPNGFLMFFGQKAET